MASEPLTDRLHETLAIFDSAEPRTTPEVAERLELGRRSTYDRLQRLCDANRIETKKVGANARVWWRSPSRREPVHGDEQFASLVDAVEEYAIFSLDREGRVRTWNPGAERIKGYEADAILGEHLSTFYVDDDVAAGLPEANLADARESGSVEEEGWRVRADGTRFWATVTITAIHDDEGALDGYAKVIRDMTQRRAYEHRLEDQTARLERQRDDLASELDDVFERIDDGFYALDEDLRFLYVNDHAKAVLSLDRSVVGEDFRDVVTMTESFESALHHAMDSQEPIIFEDFYDPIDRWFSNAIYPSESGLSVYFRDITDHKHREQDLERYETIVSTVEDGIYVLDEDGSFVEVNEAYAAMTGYDREELLGEHCSLVVGEDVSSTSAALVEQMATGELEGAGIEADIHRADGSRLRAESNFAVLPTGPNRGPEKVGVVRDVSERVERERALEESERRYRTLVEHFPDGAVGLFDDDLRYTAAGGELLADLDFSTDEIIGSTIDELYPADLVERIEPLFEAALDGERRSIEVVYRGRDLFARLLPVSSDDEVFSGMVVVQDVTERNQRERELERQREELEALNDVNEVVGRVTAAVVEQSTRREIEQVVCDALAAADAYEFAWIAAVDRNSNTFEPRATAGTDGYTEEVEVSIDPSDPRSDGPGATAIRERETQIVGDVFGDPRFEPWRDSAAAYGFTSVASIPIVHEETVYGVLGVYADRDCAFEAEERRVVSQIGRIVGHAIAATDRKQALVSDDLVELEFRLHDVFGAIDAPVSTTERITLDYAIPVGDDDFVVHGTARPDAVDAVCGLVDVLPHWKSVTVRSDDDPTAVEVRLTDPPVLSVVSEIGGYVEDFVIEEGNCAMTIHLAPTVDVRRVIDAVTESYPDAELIRRQQIVRPRDDPQRIHRRIITGLTDRQRAVLDASYHGGYFEWPRTASGEEIAASLDIAPATYSQHLRKAEKRVFDALYSS